MTATLPDESEANSNTANNAIDNGIEIGADGSVDEGVVSLLRRGLKATPELKEGFAATATIGLFVAIGRLVIPVIIQRSIDDGVVRSDDTDTVSVKMATIWANVAVAAVVVAAVAIASWINQRRLALRAEMGIANLRTSAFNRIHQFSLADHNESRRGALVSRVTSDPEALARFAQWGLFSWSINPLILLGVMIVLSLYSWQVMLIAVLAHLPALFVLRWMQKRQIVVYDEYRTSVGDMLSTFSESVSGAAAIRAYGVEDQTERGLHDSIAVRYRTRMRANRYMAGLFVIGDFFGALALVTVLVLALWQRETWGLSEGGLVACLILTNLMREPIAELSETFDQTQTAAAAWRKVLNVLDHPVDVVEPEPGIDLPPGPIEVVVENLSFGYRARTSDSDDGERTEPDDALDLALRDVTVTIPAGTNVAVVGETGSGKTTFAKLLCRLADPTSGSIRLNGVELAEASPASRIHSLRMVPQDGFLFDTSVAENVAYGSATDSTSRSEIQASFERLGLGWWTERLQNGLDTDVGERGESLSVGERQLVALARAQLVDPGLLVLDEATSAVDPETDQALTQALKRLAEGRTMVSVAHRLSTAEAADLVLVFDRGRLVEEGSHTDLVKAGGIYAGLHAAWLGNTRVNPRSP